MSPALPVDLEEPYDFAVIGSGFAGSIMSMVLRRLGRTVLLLERGAHPRFVIGESSTPFANLLLELLAGRYDLPFLKELSEWGSWQRCHPNIAAGLKRGFTFYGRDGQQLLVAASPNDSVADTHWYRPQFDQFLVQQARALGVEYRDRCEVADLSWRNASWKVAGERARFIIDASGPNSAVANALGIGTTPFPVMPSTRSLYAHFRNVAREGDQAGRAPYPPDAAAVHYLFKNGWMWVLRFNNGITSAGFAYIGSEQSWEELLLQVPRAEKLFWKAERITPWFRCSELSFRRSAAAGENFALLPSAAAFVDPLLSSGFALSLLGIVRLGEAIRRNEFDPARYESITFEEADAAADLVSALYTKFDSFPEFASLAMLYFAAMSFTENAWRLNKTELASSFLLSNNKPFTAARKRICDAARRGQPISRAGINAIIEPFDIAGLCRPERTEFFPVDTNDLVNARHKLGATRDEIQELIRKAGAK